MACFAGFLSGRETARYMVKRQRSKSIFTGATPSVRGSAGNGLRALAQSMARELCPQNIYIAYLMVDGGDDTQ